MLAIHLLGLVTTWATPQPPILINMEVCGKQVNFELDTGATVTIMSEDAFKSLFPHLHLKLTNLELKMYTGQSMDILGEASVQVGYRQQQPQDLTLVVVEGSGPTLLGRNWLKHFRLNWNSIKTVLLQQNVHLNALLEEYKDPFTDELGTIHPFKAKLAVDPTANPRYHRPRPVPFAMKAAVEEELDRLERIGVLEKVDHSDWAAPIVAVPKKDGHVRLCGDYKVTVGCRPISTAAAD